MVICALGLLPAKDVLRSSFQASAALLNRAFNCCTLNKIFIKGGRIVNVCRMQDVIIV
jgi:hypothetical protein